MPTPFQHLVYARALLTHPALPAKARKALSREARAYYLGNTAGDVQSITAQPRVETHFYHLADLATTRPYARMLATWPELANPQRLEPAHAAFISGYLAHLVWDEFWARVVFIPLYVEQDFWADWQERSVHHNALRVLLDQQAEAELRTWEAPAGLIQKVTPRCWLPFVDDAALCRWRDWLAAQLLDPAKVETAQVFAKRMQIPVEQLVEMMHVLGGENDPTPVPGLQDALAQFECQAQAESLHVLAQYWEGALQDVADQNEPLLPTPYALLPALRFEKI